MDKNLFSFLIENANKRHWNIVEMTIDEFKEAVSADTSLRFMGCYDDIPNELSFLDLFVLKADLGTKYVCIGDNELVKLIPNQVTLPLN